MNTLDAFLESALVKTAGETPLPPMVPAGGSPEYREVPTVPDAMGIKMPWLGTLGGALGGGALNYFRSKKKDRLGDTLRGAATGALVGGGAELGARVSGELARRHAAYGDPQEGPSTEATVLGGTGAGAALGGGAAWALHNFLKSRSDSED